MALSYVNGTVRVNCPGCSGALSSYENSQGLGALIQERHHQFNETTFSRVLFLLMKCGGCGRGGIAKIHANHSVSQGALEEFFPVGHDQATLPTGVPKGPESEFREAELCASTGAWRAASAMLRSALEKVLIENRYLAGNLKNKIDEAAKDGVITAARQKRAHDDIRVLGNDILHDEWRLVDEEEFNAAHHYVQRIIEDFYDHRAEVEAVLTKAGRLTFPPAP